MKLTDRQLSILKEVVKRVDVTTREINPRMWAISPVLRQLLKKGLVVRKSYCLSWWIYSITKNGRQVLQDTNLEE